jgi:arylsulfatase
MGRIIDAVKQLHGADNTIFIYIIGDNGASAEGGIEGSVNENLFFNGFPEKWQDNLKAIDDIGGPKYFNHFPSAWAHAMCAPFQWTKQIASHFGGTRNPMVVSWPAKIKDRGGLREQFLHTIDIAPTLYEVIGITPPQMLGGVPQKPIEGVSFAYTFDDAKAKGRRTTQYFEMGCARAIYQDGWMASSNPVVPWNPTRAALDIDKVKWELYHIDKDFSQARKPGEAAPTARSVVDRSGQAQRAAAGLARHRATQCRIAGPAEPRRRRHDLHLLFRSARPAERRGPAHP